MSSSKKRGKYKPLSYFIEKDLIFYSSLDQTKKFIAFGIIKIQKVSKLLQILNKFLNQTCLKSYTIQMGVNNGIFIILQFINEEKRKIAQDYFKLYELLVENEIHCSILEKNQLEIEFLGILYNGGSSRLSELRISSSHNKKGLTITNDKTSLNYFFYNIKLNLITDDTYFFQHMRKLLVERELKGYIFMHNSINEFGALKGAAYIVVVQKEEDTPIDFVSVSNEFFKIQVFEIQKPKINSALKYLWRIPLNGNLTRINCQFIMDPQKILSTKNEFLRHLENKLTENDIEYEISDNFQILINQNYICSIFSSLDLNTLSKIIKENINKYHILILVINKTDYLKLVSYDNITNINNLTILNKEEFLDLDYGIFN